MGKQTVPQGLDQVRGILLDIGAGDRWLEKYLSNAVQYVALDYPPTGHNLYGARPSVFADAAHLPFVDSRFDAIVCLEVIEHVPDPKKVMCEIARVLKPGANAWLSVPFLYPLHDAPFDFQRFTAHGLRRCAEAAGLQVLSLEKSGHAIRTAGLLACLAVAGSALAAGAARKGLLLLLALPFIFTINVAAWLLSCIWPDWGHMSHGHTMLVRKPCLAP